MRKAAVKKPSPAQRPVSAPEPAVRASVPVVLSLVVAGLTLLSFWPCLANDFNYDDTTCLLENANYRGLGAAQLGWMFTTFRMGHYQPLTWVSFGLDYILWGMNPWGYHLTSLVLHCANAVLVYWLALALIRRALGSASDHLGGFAVHAAAAFAALVFSLHPLRVESVAWATDRADVLSTFFLLLCLLAYVRAATGEGQRGRNLWLGAAVVCYACGLLSRGTGVPLPLVLLLLDWYPLRRLAFSRGDPPAPPLGRLLLEKLPFVILAIAAGVLAPLAKADEGLTIPLSEHGVVGRIAQACYGLVFYVMKTFAPVGLVPIYELRPPLAVLTARYIVPMVLVAAVGLALLRYRRRMPGVTVAVLSYAILIAPLLGLVQAGTQEVADRYVYWPGISLAMLAGGLLAWLVGRQPATVGRRILIPAAAVALVALDMLSWRQSLVWRSEESLWTHAVRNGPTCAAAHYNLGYVYANHGRVADAVGQFEAGRQIKPRWTIARLMAGRALAQASAWEEVARLYRDVLATEPGNGSAAEGLGQALLAQRRPAEAEAAYRQAVQYEPGSAEAWFGLGNALVRQNRVQEAADAYDQAVRIAPQHAKAHHNLGTALAQLGRFEAAEREYRQALELEPAYVEGHLSLANLLEQAGRPQEALAAYQAALQLRPSADVRCRLAALLTQQGRTAEAIAQLQQALQTDPNHAEAQRRLAILKRQQSAQPP